MMKTGFLSEGRGGGGGGGGMWLSRSTSAHSTELATAVSFEDRLDE
jgi:hypothetical protein